MTPTERKNFEALERKVAQQDYYIRLLLTRVGYTDDRLHEEKFNAAVEAQVERNDRRPMDEWLRENRERKAAKKALLEVK